MASFDKIHPFIPSGNNVTESWRKWRADFLDYLEANNLTGEEVTDKRRIAVFRRVCGDELKSKIDSLELAENCKVDDVLKKFDELFKKCANEVFASYKFWSPKLQQEDQESFEQFYVRVREGAVDCNFKDALSRNIRDKLIIGIRNHALRERLLRENVLDEKSVVEQCRISEQSRFHCEQMSNVVNESPVSSVQVLDYDKRRQFQRCSNCGRKHKPRSCPAFGKTCNSCGQLNHWTKMCRMYQDGNTRRNDRKVHDIQNDDEEENTLFISELSLDVLKSEWIVNAVFDGNVVMSCKIDTGAQVNLISLNRFNQLRCKPKTMKSKTVLRAFGGNQIELLGQCYLNVTLNNVKLNLLFEISKVDTKTILGLSASKNFGLLRVFEEIKVSMRHEESPEEILSEFDDVFKGSGSLKPMSIVLKENAVPNIATMRKIPLALQKLVRTELQTMEENGIIAKVDQPTDWVSNFHVIRKSNDTVRIVLDPRPLNKYIKRPHFYIPSMDELLVKLSDCKFFTVLDAKTAFWQQPLEDKSSYLTTFTTPFGRYRFLKVPYGLVNAPENFQSIMFEIFKDIDGVEPYFDDIVIGTKTIEEHCIILRKVLEAARKNCLKFNKEKVQLAQPMIRYLGQNLSKDGLSLHPSRIEAISNYPTPTNADELNRFLAMYRYNSNFVENLSHHSHPLRLLLKKNVVWTWDANQQKCFDDLKQRLIKAPILQLFNPKQPLKLSVDASGFGLGATLLQNGKPIGFASASLKEEQKRYAQIEKEQLAVVFGLHHFNFFTYGRHVIVETDHKPLVGLKEKPFESISPRLQKLLYKTIKYDYQLVYVPGKELVTADALSRAPLESVKFDPSELSSELQQSLNVCVLATATDQRWVALREQTAKDPQLQCVKEYISSGWPETIKAVKSVAQPYWHCRNELHVVEGVMCRGQRLVIPKESVKNILSLLHEAHDGIVACKAKAREYFYWVSMNEDIDKVFMNCDICQKYQKSNSHEPVTEREIPYLPWQRVGADFFELGGKDYLLVIDYFSKFIELQLMHGKTAGSTITAFKCICARYGIPEELISDRGPPYTSREMQEFYRDWNISHNPSTPYYARSNGEVERCVQTIKAALTKAFEDAKDPFIVLLNYRTTSKNGLPSPAELLMGRKLRSKLPVHPKKLEPMYPIENAKEQLKVNQEKQKIYADKSTKCLTDLNNGDKVWFQMKKTSPWVRGCILEANNEHRSYKLKTSNGSTYVRNRVFIRPDLSNEKNVNHYQTSVEDYYGLKRSPQANIENSNPEEPHSDPDSETDFESAELNDSTPSIPEFEDEELQHNDDIEQHYDNEEAHPTRPVRTIKKPSHLNDFELDF